VRDGERWTFNPRERFSGRLDTRCRDTSRKSKYKWQIPRLLHGTEIVEPGIAMAWHCDSCIPAAHKDRYRGSLPKGKSLDALGNALEDRLHTRPSPNKCPVDNCVEAKRAAGFGDKQACPGGHSCKKLNMPCQMKAGQGHEPFRTSAAKSQSAVQSLTGRSILNKGPRDEVLHDRGGFSPHAHVPMCPLSPLSAQGPRDLVAVIYRIGTGVVWYDRHRVGRSSAARW
jgi:hypothetical protein